MTAIQSDPNPYVGPESYTRNDTRIFAGRETEARNLLSLALSSRVVLFYADSGAGKTSLINARLIPKLEEKNFEVLPVGRVSGSAIVSEQINNIYIYNLMLSLHQKKGGLDPKRFGKMRLTDFLMRITTDGRQFFFHDPVAPPPESSSPDASPPSEAAPNVPQIWPRALIIDQFEEILTAHPEAWRKREAFFRQINQAMQDDEHLWVIFSMRQEYVATLRAAYAHLLPGNLQTRYYMQHMDTRAAFKAVTRPALKQNRPFDKTKNDKEKTVADELVAELAKIRVKQPDGSIKRVEGKFVEAVQLQVVCYQLWENLKDSFTKQDKDEDIPIKREDINRALVKSKSADLADFIDTALAQFYADAVAAIAAETGQFEFDLRHWFETHLITPGHTRAFVVQEGETIGGLDQKVVGLLQKKFLIRSEERAGAQWYELIHDRFIDPILQSNIEWEKDHPHIQAAREWVGSDNDKNKLYQGQQLKAAWQHPDAKIELVKNFLTAGKKEEEDHENAIRAEEEQKRIQQLAEKEKQRADDLQEKADEISDLNKRLKIYFVFAILAAFVALFAFGFAYVQWGDAVAASTREANQRATAEAAKEEERLAKETAQAQAEQNEKLAEEKARQAERADAEKQRADNLADAFKLAFHAAKIQRDQPDSDDPPLLLLEALNIADSPDIRAELEKELKVSPIKSASFPHESRLNRLALSPNKETLAVADYNGKLSLWNIQNQKEADENFLTLGHPIYGLAFDPEGRRLAVSTGNRNIDDAASEHSIILWDMANQISQTIASQMGSVWSAAFSPNGKHLATGHYDGSVILWDWSNTPPISQTLTGGHTDWVWHVTFHPTDNNILASSGRDGKIILWNLSTSPATSQTLSGHTEWVNHVAFSPDGQKLVSASDDSAVLLWDLSVAPPESDEPFKHGFEAWNATFDETGKIFASGGYAALGGKGNIILWDVEENRQVGKTLDQHNNGVEDIIFAENTLISIGRDGQLIFWDKQSIEDSNRGSLSEIIVESNNLRINRNDDDILSNVALSRNGQTLASIENGALTFWDLTTGSAEKLSDLAGSGTGLAFNDDGTLLAVSQQLTNTEATIEVWDLAHKEKLNDFQLVQPVNVLAFSPDNKMLATVEGDTITLWKDPATQRNPDTMLLSAPDMGNITKLNFSPSGQILAAGDKNGGITLWKNLLASSAISHTVAAHSGGWINDIAFRNDEVMASAGDDGLIKLWNTATGNLIGKPMAGHTEWVLGISFSPSGNRLATAGKDQTIRLWDVDQQQPVLTPFGDDYFEGHKARVWQATFNTDDELVSISSDNTVRYWSLTPDLKTFICQRVVKENITLPRWEESFKETPDKYQKTCPGLPAPNDVIEAILRLKPSNIHTASKTLSKTIELASPAKSGSTPQETVFNIILNLRKQAIRDNLIDYSPKSDYYVQAADKLAPSFNLVAKLNAFAELTKAQAAFDDADYEEALSALDMAIEQDRQFDFTSQADVARLYARICQAADEEDVIKDACSSAVGLSVAVETGQSHQGTLQPGQGNALRLKVEGQLDQPLAVELESSPGSFIDVTLINPQTAQPLEPILWDTSPNIEEYVLPAEDDTFLLILEDTNYNNQSVTYTIFLKESINAGQIPSGQKAPDELKPNTYHQWRFEGSVGDIVTIEMTRTNSSFTPYLALFQTKTGASIASEHQDRETVTLKGISLPERGEYTVVIGGRGDSAGAYELMVEKEIPRPIEAGQEQESNINEQVLWSFQGEAGQVVDITMTISDPEFDPLLSLLDSDGHEVAWDDDSGGGLNAQIQTFVISSTGEYLIKAGRTGAAADYTLLLAEVPTQTLEFGQPLPITTTYDGVWLFEGRAGQVVKITGESANPNSLPALTLRQPDREIIFDYQINDTILLRQNGLYVLRPSTGRNTGAYTITLETIAPKPITTSIQAGEPVTVSGSIAPRGYQPWAFEGESGQSIRIEMQADNSILDTYITLYGPGGVYLIENDDRGDGTRNSLIDAYALPETGLYTILAHGYPGSSGAYKLTLMIDEPK